MTIPLLGIYPTETCLYVYQNIFTKVFIAAVLIISRIRKLPKCSSTVEWINKMF